MADCRKSRGHTRGQVMGKIVLMDIVMCRRLPHAACLYTWGTSRYPSLALSPKSDGIIPPCRARRPRYIAGRFLPDKAIDLMDEATAQVGEQTRGSLRWLYRFLFVGWYGWLVGAMPPCGVG